MSKQLKVAIASGRVAVENKTAGEVYVYISMGAYDRKSILIPAYGTTEICPKHISAKLANRIINLTTLVQSGALKIL